MAEDKKNRKSSRHFNLEKPVERSFVIEKDADILAATPTKPESKTQPAVPIAPVKRQEDVKKPSVRKFDLSKDSEEVNLEELKKELLADGKLDAEEVDKLREVLYADGKIDQEKADFVFELNDAVSGKKNDPTWNQFFVQVISDYLLKDEKSPGVIDEDEGKWLVEKIGADGQVDGVEKQLLNHLKQNAKKMPIAVTALLTGDLAENGITPNKTDLQQLKKDILADGTIDKEEVIQLREVLYADGKIDQEEADFVFELNDAVSGKKNDPTWNQFFVQVISDYLLKDEKSPGVIDEDEGKWLVEKIGADGQVDGVEKQLLNHLKQNAKKMPVSVSSLLNDDRSTLDVQSTSEDSSEKTSKKWKWLIPAAIIAAAVSSYFYFTGSGDTPKKEQIVINTSNSGQNNTNDSAASPNVDTVENNNSEIVDNSVGSNDVENAGNTENAGNSNNNDTGSSSSETGSVGNSPSGTKGSAQPSEGQSSQNNNKPTSGSSASSTTSTKSGNDKAGNTGSPSGQGKSVSNNSENDGAKDSSVIPGSTEQKALDVIRGVYGNGQVRKDKLGAEYAEIQKLVNEMYRTGKVKR